MHVSLKCLHIGLLTTVVLCAGPLEEVSAQDAQIAAYRLPITQEGSAPDATGMPMEADVSVESAEPWRLADALGWNGSVDFGGWVSLGYHGEESSLVNGNPDRINLQQGWVFAEQSANAENGGVGLGFRIDALFGTDANDTAAFGNGRNSQGQTRGWDSGSNFERGSGYGWALPQAYLEVAGEDWSVKAGHFFTLIGYEVVPSTGNFFYSHAMAMYNSEPVTHSGVLGTYQANEQTTIYGGWTAGWDTGFDQYDDGSNLLAGVSTAPCDDLSLTYMMTIGDFGARGQDGFMHSIVVDASLSARLSYALQSDMLTVESTGERSIGLNQYLFYDVSDQWSLGTRLEWWKADAASGYAPHGGTTSVNGDVSHFGATAGANVRINSNVTLRPEFRYDWSEGADYNQGSIGIDLVATF